jgi:hypothetical protein
MRPIIVPLHSDHLPYLAEEMGEGDWVECASMGPQGGWSGIEQEEMNGLWKSSLWPE